MKVFIIFLAILIINISFLVHQGDMGRYLRTQTTVKAIAEECGAGAALFFNEACFGDGFLVAEPEEAVRHIEYVIDEAGRTDPYLNGRQIDYHVTFFDDSFIAKRFANGVRLPDQPFAYPFSYVDFNGKEIIIDVPSVVVTVNIEQGMKFRMPFFHTAPVARSAMYELKPADR